MSFSRACGYLLLLGSMAQFGVVANAQTPHPAKQAGPEAQNDPAQTPPSFDPAQRSGSNMESPSAGDGHAVNSASDLPLIPLCPPVPLVSSAMFAPGNEFTLGVTPAVPIHEREAEIWFKLPPNTRLTVNFREYSDVGEFCIVKTKIPTRDARRYFFSARRLDGKDWTDLIPATPQDTRILGINELNQHFVDLVPSSHVLVDFCCNEPVQPIEPSAVESETPVDCCNELLAALNTLNTTLSNHGAAVQMNSLKMASLQAEVEKLSSALKTPVQPPVAAPVTPVQTNLELTNSFQFKTSELKIAEVIATTRDFQGIPPSLVISSVRIPAAISGTPTVSAKLKLTIERTSFRGDVRTVTLIESTDIDLKKNSTSFEGAIALANLVGTAFNTYMNDEYLANVDPKSQIYQIQGILEFKDDGGNLVSGPLANKIEVRVVKN